MDQRKSDSANITQLLHEWGEGRSEAIDQLLPLIYSELHRQTAAYMRRERQSHTRQTTALVHEAHMKLVDQRQVDWKNRGHFFAIAAQAMRRILVDHAKNRNLEKRGGLGEGLPLEEALLAAADETNVDIVALDEALPRLAEFDPQQERIVELRYFAGLSLEAAAATLNISRATAAREMIEEAIAFSRESGDRFGLGASLARLGDIAAADGDFAAARSLSGQALAIYRELGYKEGISAKLNNLGAAGFLEGDHEEARACFDEALAKAQELGEKINTRLIFDGYAALAAEAGDYARVARLSGVADSLGASIGYAVEPAEKTFRDAYLGKLCAAMSVDEFSAEHEAGRRLAH